jgi:hypothetical protein
MSSCSLILQEKKEKRVNEKHDILAWDRGRNIGSFLVIVPCMYVL